MSAIEQLEAQDIRLDAERGMRMLHLEHPERVGEAWCGAPVEGVRVKTGRLDCIVCADLRRAHRRRRS